jgi:hypothetical protein
MRANGTPKKAYNLASALVTSSQAMQPPISKANAETG